MRPLSLGCCASATSAEEAEAAVDVEPARLGFEYDLDRIPATRAYIARGVHGEAADDDRFASFAPLTFSMVVIPTSLRPLSSDSRLVAFVAEDAEVESAVATESAEPDADKLGRLSFGGGWFAVVRAAGDTIRCRAWCRPCCSISRAGSCW